MNTPKPPPTPRKPARPRVKRAPTPTPPKAPAQPTAKQEGPSDARERALLKEALRRERQAAAAGAAAVPTEKELEQAGTLRLKLFVKQQLFFFPGSKKAKRRRAARCGRRAGKTTGSAIKILVTLLENPRAVALYVAQAAPIIRETIWPEVIQLIADYDLPFSYHETALRIRHKRSTGRAIFRGADNKKTVEKFRGLGIGGNFKLAILDESGSWGSAMENMVKGVISPALRDCKGELLAVGSPGYFPEGFFYEATFTGQDDFSDLVPSQKMKSFETMHWTIQDNPFIDDEDKAWETIIEEEGLSGYDDPIFIREWKGRYCINTHVQMFEYDPARNNYYHGAPEGLTYWLGVDFGYTDETALVVLAFSEKSKQMWAVDSWAKTEQVSDDINAQYEKFKALYPITRIIGDTGGSGKGTAAEWMADYGVYIEQANKNEKLNHIEFINSAFRRGDILIRSGLDLCSELPRVMWNEQRTDAHPKSRDNQSMALMYVWRAARFIAGKLNHEPRRTHMEESGAVWPQHEIDAKAGITPASSNIDNLEWAEWLHGNERLAENDYDYV